MPGWSLEAEKAGDGPLQDQTLEKSLSVTQKYTAKKFKMVGYSICIDVCPVRWYHNSYRIYFHKAD